MTVIDPPRDARRAFDLINAGGVAILPNDVGYSLIGGPASALKTNLRDQAAGADQAQRDAGQRRPHREVHLVDERGRGS